MAETFPSLARFVGRANNRWQAMTVAMADEHEKRSAQGSPGGLPVLIALLLMALAGVALFAFVAASSHPGASGHAAAHSTAPARR